MSSREARAEMSWGTALFENYDNRVICERTIPDESTRNCKYREDLVQEAVDRLVRSVGYSCSPHPTFSSIRSIKGQQREPYAGEIETAVHGIDALWI